MCRSKVTAAEKARAWREPLCAAIRTAIDSADERRLRAALKAGLSTLWAVGACGKYDSGENCGAAADQCLGRLAKILEVNRV